MQAPQAGYGAGYDAGSYGGYGAAGAAYQSAPQAADPVPQFAPQSRASMAPGSGSFSAQMGASGYGAAPSAGPAPQAPAYAPQPSRVCLKRCRAARDQSTFLEPFNF